MRIYSYEMKDLEFVRFATINHRTCNSIVRLFGHVSLFQSCLFYEPSGNAELVLFLFTTNFASV
jgi:hypothetical protein